MKTARIVKASFVSFLMSFLFVSASFAESSNLGAYILPAGGVKSGDPIPLFHAKSVRGEDLDLRAMKREGKKVVLAFWSMYCAACVEKFNSMIKIQEKYEPEGLMVVSINTDGEYRKGEQHIRDFIADYEKKQGVKVNFPVLYDETNWLALALSIDFLPTIITVNEDGMVHNVYRRFGEASEEEILAGVEEIVQSLLAGGAGSEEPAGMDVKPQ